MFFLKFDCYLKIVESCLARNLAVFVGSMTVSIKTILANWITIYYCTMALFLMKPDRGRDTPGSKCADFPHPYLTSLY